MRKRNIKTVCYFGGLVIATLSTSCQKETIGLDLSSVQGVPKMKVQALISQSDDISTRTYMDGMPSDAYRYIHWEKGDCIFVEGGERKFTCTSDIGDNWAEFEGDATSDEITFAYFPYSPNISLSPRFFLAAGIAYLSHYIVSTQLPSIQKYHKDGVASDSYPMMAYYNEEKNGFLFEHLCGILVLKVCGAGEEISSVSFENLSENASPVSGDVEILAYRVNPLFAEDGGSPKVTLDCIDESSGKGVVIGKEPVSFHIVLPPAEYKSFKVVITATNGSKMEIISNKTLLIQRAMRTTAATLAFHSSVLPVENATANCYVVKPGESVIFPTVKGNTTESVGPVSSVSVLWESFGTDIKPAVNDVVQNVMLSGTDSNWKIAVTAGKKEGNAVIAAKDVSGNILWSWHIWVTSADLDALAQVYNNGAGTMMDRNLGATSATPGDVGALGLLYQWGRKDPFLGSSSISNSTKAKSTITWPSPVESNSSNGTIVYATSHPTTFITYNNFQYDWYYTGFYMPDNTRWNSSKGTYDPCPPGYRVPDGGNNGVWSTALESSSELSNGPWNSTNKGMNIKSYLTSSTQCWYSASGYLDSDSGSIIGVGNSGNYWSCTPNGGSSYGLFFSYNGDISPSISYGYRAYGLSVRCSRE